MGGEGIMPTTAEDLLKIKRHRDDAKSRHDQLTGQRLQVLEQLKNDYNCLTVEEARAYRQSLVDEDARLEKELTDGVRELREELGW